MDPLDLERAGLYDVADRQHFEVDVAQLVLVELRARHRDRQLAAVDDGDLLLPEVADHPRQRAEMVLVAVRDHERLDRVDVLAQVREVGQDEVDAHHLGRREPQAAVDDDDPAVVLDDRQVLADLADASQREDAECSAQREATPAASTPCLARTPVDVRPLGLVALHERQPEAADVVPEHPQRGLHRRRAGGDEHRRVDLLQRRVDLRARFRLVVHPAHLGPDDVRGDADAAGAADVQAAGVDVVVAGQDREPVDQLQLVRVGLLDRVDPVDLRQLREQVRAACWSPCGRGCCRARSACSARPCATSLKCARSPRRLGLL